VAKRLAGDQEVVCADRFAEMFKGRAYPPRLLCVFWCEVENLEGTRQEGGNAFGVLFGPLTLGGSIPELKQHDRGGGNQIARRADTHESAPNRVGPAVDQRNARIGIKEIRHSKIFREGVAG
jgi:hypothetical protein